MRLPGAQIVSTRALLTAMENIRAAIEAKAMICIYGQVGHGKSFAVSASLRGARADADPPDPVPGPADGLVRWPGRRTVVKQTTQGGAIGR
ncbi:hypothetical protein ACFU8W_46600 [Streptomyces sp. NPDC057565]|uniref:hypothetical protein n=1 Tax=Streptomyces sp. NPDC057565 TaxID=3346169 RepID=UPI00369BFEB9